MARQSYQRGCVLGPFSRRYGKVFIIRYRVRGSDGRWTQKADTLQGVCNKKAARAELDRRIREATNQPLQAVNLTVRAFVDTYWRPYLDRRGAKPSTRRAYESVLEKQILPRIGEIRMTDVRPLHIESIVQDRLKAGVSGKTVRNELGLIGGVFSLAEDNDVISKSPVRKKHKPKIVKTEKPIWTPAQVKSILDGVPRVHQAFFACAALTGARLGELLGLQWKHVDLEKGKLAIRQSLWNGSLLPPKTEGSIRTVYFGEALRLTLQEHRQNASHRSDEDFVFCKPDGAPLNPDVIRRNVLYPTLDRLRIPRSSRCAGLHTFRHAAASFINAETGNLKLAQKLLGHSTLDMTANVYTHTDADAERGAALALERAIFGDLFQTVPRIENKNNSEAIN